MYFNKDVGGDLIFQGNLFQFSSPVLLEDKYGFAEKKFKGKKCGKKEKFSSLSSEKIFSP